jgi:hypothetical protein
MSETRTKEPTREEQLNRALNEMVDRYEVLEAEIDGLRVENAGLKRQLEALTNADGAVAVLRELAHNKDLPAELRCKAATALAPYETAK